MLHTLMGYTAAGMSAGRATTEGRVKLPAAKGLKAGLTYSHVLHVGGGRAIYTAAVLWF